MCRSASLSSIVDEDSTEDSDDELKLTEITGAATRIKPALHGDEEEISTAAASPVTGDLFRRTER